MFKNIIIGVTLFLIGASLANANCYDVKSNNSDYIKCINNISSIFTQGYNAFNTSNYTYAVMYYEEYLVENGDFTSEDYMSARYNLYLANTKLGNSSFHKKEYRLAVGYFLKAIGYGNSTFELQYNLGASYYNLKEYPNAGLHATNAYNLATEKSDIEIARNLLNDIEKEISISNAIASAPTNDTYSFAQYYITDLNIPDAWKQITNPKQVIVAVIDDGININHPDLTNSIWVSSRNVYGSSKIINFQNDNLPDNLSAGEHGTMVAGIIGASTNNNEGIAGIGKNVKLMPIRVFDLEGHTKEDYIIKAINFAVNNGANIINLSLGGSQFTYSKGMDEAIKKAYDKDILVVIAGGNGDILSDGKSGVNLDINPISPVCNNKGMSYSFGIFATDKDGYKTRWTNYGKCTPFFAPGEGIVSTSIPTFNANFGENYNELAGTSFSAPIVSGILALGYNKYGKLPYSVAYDALTRATTINAKGNPVLDANRYLNNLQVYFDNQNSKKLAGLKYKAQTQFGIYKKQYARFSKDAQKSKYQSLLTGFQKKEKTLKGDSLILNNLIVELINVEISRL